MPLTDKGKKDNEVHEKSNMARTKVRKSFMPPVTKVRLKG